MKRTVTMTLIAAALAGCGSDTGRARVAFDVSVETLPVATTANEFGYTVTLTRADLSVSRLAFFDGEPLFTKSWPERLGDILIPSAYAHPGHYTPGEALGELLTERQFDLLAKPVQLWGTADGVTGNYASAELDLGGSSGTALLLEGVATGPVGEIPFSARLDGVQAVIGLTVGINVDESPLAINVTVDLNELVKRMDFGQIASPEEIAAAQGALPVTVDTQPYNAFTRGAIGNQTYRFAAAK